MFQPQPYQSFLNAPASRTSIPDQVQLTFSSIVHSEPALLGDPPSYSVASQKAETSPPKKPQIAQPSVLERIEIAQISTVNQESQSQPPAYSAVSTQLPSPAQQFPPQVSPRNMAPLQPPPAYPSANEQVQGRPAISIALPPSPQTYSLPQFCIVSSQSLTSSQPPQPEEQPPQATTQFQTLSMEQSMPPQQSSVLISPPPYSQVAQSYATIQNISSDPISLPQVPPPYPLQSGQHPYHSEKAQISCQPISPQ